MIRDTLIVDIQSHNIRQKLLENNWAIPSNVHLT